MAKKESSFAAVAEKFSAKRQLPCDEIKPLVLNDLWAGFHEGAVYSIWAEKGAGKSTLTFQVLRSLCKQGKKGVFVDIEKAFNEFQQESFGLKEYIDNGQLTVLTCSNWKDYEEIVEALDESGMNFFVTDSITMIMAYTPKTLKVEDVRPGLKAQQAASVLGKLKDIAYNNEIGTILLYHARANIQIVGANPYAPQTKMAGGLADAHIPDVITKIQTHSKIKGEGDDPIGVEISIVCEKNKYCAPFQTRREKLIFGKGIDAKISLIEKAIELGVIKQSGSSFILPEHDNIRGRKALYELPGSYLTRLKEIVTEVQHES
jgi:recombination protein RecA